MAYYLVHAQAKNEKLAELKDRLDNGEIRAMRPFGQALDGSLRGAKVLASGEISWEELDYCSPPLAMERAAVLDDYFTGLSVEKVTKGEGWQHLKGLPSLWDKLELSEIPTGQNDETKTSQES